MQYSQSSTNWDIQHAYQPIFNLTNFAIWGYEAFLRVNKYGGDIESFFSLARKYQQLYELDTKSIEEAITNFYQERDKITKIFLNVYTSSLIHPSFEDFFKSLLNKLDIKPSRVILEINESEEITDMQVLQKKLENLRAKGIKIAIDDFGKGGASIKNVIEVIPDYIKLDKYFAHNLSSSEEKQKMVKTLVEHFKDDTKIILEGIEHEEDLAMAKFLGVPFGQGYLLGKPEYIVNKYNVAAK